MRYTKTMLSEKRMTVEEYLEFEKHSELRHEFTNGVLHAMAGETKRHEEIVLNIVQALRPIAKTKGCRLQTKTIQLRVSSSRYRYPDVMINCIPNSDLRLEETPCFLLEVISESSADIDSNKKLAEYTRIPSVQRYVLIEQHSKLAIVYKRQNGVWLVETIEETGEIEIPCLETVLTLEQIYDGLGFA